MLKKLNIVFLILSISCSCCGGYNETLSEYGSMPVLFHLDNYDQCMLLGKEALFCSFTFELHPLHSDNQSYVWNIISRVISDPRNYRHDHLRHGICVTTTCPNAATYLEETAISENINVCYNAKYQHMGLRGNITNIYCETTKNKYPIDTFHIVTAALFILYIAFVIFASIYEGTARYQKKEVYEKITGTICGKILASFSIPKNWYRLMSSNKNPDAVKLRCIQGMRFYTMICVILCHTIMVSFAGPVSNTQYVEHITDNPLNMFVANGQYVVQSFFVISGWLLSFYFFQMLESKKNINPKYLVLAFINRYIRLTPTLAVVIAFQTTWFIQLGRGPQWENLVGEEYRNCRKNWWTNLLYINNYVNKGEMCLKQTWYLAADTQLYLLSLIILMVGGKNPRKLKIMFIVGIITGLLITGCIAYFGNYDIILRQYPERLYHLNNLNTDEFHVLYSSGYSNITGYLIGLTFGYLFYEYRNKKLATKRIYTVLWWIFTFGPTVFVVLIAAIMYSPDYENTCLESALYWSLGKAIFALGIAVGIFGFTQKIGWYARWLCEWEPAQFFGRLTYSAYVIHTAVILIRMGYMRSPIFINEYILSAMNMGHIVISYLGGTLLCLCFEMPISSLQKLMIPQLERKSPKCLSERSLKTLNYDECNSKNKTSNKV